MGTCYVGEAGYGLFLNEDEVEAYANAYETRHKTGNSVRRICLDSGASYLSEDNYDVRNITHLKKGDYKEDMDDFVIGAFFYAKKQGSILLRDEANCYASLTEMADEFRSSLGECLPDNFDYEDHLCYFCGAAVD